MPHRKVEESMWKKAHSFLIRIDQGELSQANGKEYQLDGY